MRSRRRGLGGRDRETEMVGAATTLGVSLVDNERRSEALREAAQLQRREHEGIDCECPTRPIDQTGSDIETVDTTIKADLFRYTGAEYSHLRLIRRLREPGFRFTFFLRLAARHSKVSLRGICYRLLLRHYSYKFGYQIGADTTIGAGLYIGHFGSIVINRRTVIGRNCNIAHGVTIGQSNRGPRAGTPVIGDRVWIGTNAIIVGNVTIGSDVLIAPGAFVNFDVPSGSIVVGNPGRIHPNPNATVGYISRAWA